MIEEISVTDSIALTDSLASLTGYLTMTDSLALTDAGYPEPIATDSILLIDTAYRAQNETTVDEMALPHVQSISVQEPSILQELPIMDGLPYRKQRGKEGRRVAITGWTDSLSALETLRGYADGETHLLILPTGDSMMVHVTHVHRPEDVANYDRYDYVLTAVEVVD
jgi:hypothetical protein